MSPVFTEDQLREALILLDHPTNAHLPEGVWNGFVQWIQDGTGPLNTWTPDYFVDFLRTGTDE
jgi:hypothetical protein